MTSPAARLKVSNRKVLPERGAATIMTGCWSASGGATARVLLIEVSQTGLRHGPCRLKVKLNNSASPVSGDRLHPGFDLTRRRSVPRPSSDSNPASRPIPTVPIVGTGVGGPVGVVGLAVYICSPVYASSSREAGSITEMSIRNINGVCRPDSLAPGYC